MENGVNTIVGAYFGILGTSGPMLVWPTPVKHLSVGPLIVSKIECVSDEETLWFDVSFCAAAGVIF